MHSNQSQYHGNRSNNKASFPGKLHSPKTDNLKGHRRLSTGSENLLGSPPVSNKELSPEPMMSEYSYMYDNQDSASDMASETGYYSMSGYQEESIFDSESYEDNFDLDLNTPAEPLALVATHTESQKQTSPGGGYNPIDLSLNHALDLTVRIEAMDYRISSASPQPIEISDDSISETGSSGVGISQKGISQTSGNSLRLAPDSVNVKDSISRTSPGIRPPSKQNSISVDSERIILGSSPDLSSSHPEPAEISTTSHQIWYVSHGMGPMVIYLFHTAGLVNTRR